MKKLVLILIANIALADFEAFFEANKKSVNLSEFKNPFFDEGVSDESLKLQVILGDRAKINDKWVSKNDKIGGAKVLKITSNFVLLENDDGKVRLKLSRQNPKITIKAR